MGNLVAYGAYVPSWRLERSAMRGGGRGTRAVASYDEDATTMGVEAAPAVPTSSGARPTTARSITAGRWG
jgi:hydroxymethylglutaryl-CoA synthase